MRKGLSILIAAGLMVIAAITGSAGPAAAAVSGGEGIGCFNFTYGFQPSGACQALTPVWVYARVSGQVNFNTAAKAISFRSGTCSFGPSSSIRVGGFTVTSIDYETTACKYWKPDSTHLIIRHEFKTSPLYSSYVGVVHRGWIQVKFASNGSSVVQKSIL